MTTLPKPSPPEQPEFDWIQYSGDYQQAPKTFLDSAWEKTKSNPFVPIGAFGATGALIYGLISMTRNDKVMSQKMMRLRVSAQAFAILAMVGGLMLEGRSREKKTDE